MFSSVKMSNSQEVSIRSEAERQQVVRRLYEEEIERQRYEKAIPDEVRQRIEGETSRQKFEAKIPAEALLDWYDALYDRDCKQLMELLGKDPRLLKAGWGIGWSEASHFQWRKQRRKPWVERTALHVAARRGCAKLVEQILLFFKERPMISKYFQMKEQEEKNSAVDEAHNTHSIASTSQDTAPPVALPIEHPVDSNPDFLFRLLLCKEGEFKLDAIGIAAIHYNRQILLPLVYAWAECDPENVRVDSSNPSVTVTRDSEEDKKYRVKLREVTEDVVSRFESTTRIIRRYSESLEFNFLPWNEYLFHFLFSEDAWGDEWLEVAKALWTAVRPGSSDSPWRFLLGLQDGQGRTPFHVAVDFRPGFRPTSSDVVTPIQIDRFIEILTSVEAEDKEEVIRCALTTCNAAGMTTLQNASMRHNYELASWFALLAVANFVHKNKELVSPSLLHEPWAHSTWSYPIHLKGMNRRILSANNGFGRSTQQVFATEDGREQRRYNPIHGLILVGDWVATERVLSWAKRRLSIKTDYRNLSSHERSQIREYLGLDRLCRGVVKIREWEYMEADPDVELDATELATLLGNVKVTRMFVQVGYNKEFEGLQSRRRRHQPWPALHIAANLGNYEMLKMLLDLPLYDPYLVDFEGNSALHHALHVVTIPEFEFQLFDFPNVESIHFVTNARKEHKQEVVHNDPLTERQGCINLLLQAGLDIFNTNNKGQPPYPQGELSKYSKFVSWWYKKQEKEFETIQNTMSFAGNAIAVTATLVATASYVGPLQPPLGFAGDPSQIQDDNLWVRIFIFCDTMSFYLAICAIILSLITSLPVPQQPTSFEIQRNRRMVTMAVIVLFPSVIFVLLAFVASSISVVSAKAVSSTGGLVTIITASLGGLFCLGTFFLFFVRLLAFIFPKAKWVRNMYFYLS